VSRAADKICEVGTNASHIRDGAPHTVPEGGLRAPQRGTGPGEARPAAAAQHLYVHLPFCAHRCGYCDFVTAVGKQDEHAPYVEALLLELALERDLLADDVQTVFVGGGTPTFTEPTALARLLAALPTAAEVTVEANPETVTPELAALLRRHGVNRISLGAQSFQPHLLEVLERRASPADVRAAVPTLRAAGFDNLSLDLIYGIPGQTREDLTRDLDAALALEPEHLSCYELEAKPGTRFTHAHGDELERQAEALEGYFEAVVETLTGAGYRWYETANFCRGASGRDLRAQHNLGYWRGRDYLGIGVGAVSTVGGLRWKNAPSVRRYTAALARAERPARELEPLAAEVQASERDAAIDADAVARLDGLGLARSLDGGATLQLTDRGRFLGGGVTAELLADSPG
jgi:oxygen-independent coproporphyrinogen-3 oxidase